MSTYDTVREDYGLADEAPVTGGGKERRIWETTSVAPDPHTPGHFYAVQRLAGEWKRESENSKQVVWCKRANYEAPVTRVLYCTMDEYGKMVNVNRDASQGKAPKIEIHIDPTAPMTWTPNQLRVQAQREIGFSA